MNAPTPTILPLLVELVRRGVRLTVKANRLTWDAPRGAVDADTLTRMKAAKADLLVLLAASEPTSAQAPNRETLLAVLPADVRRVADEIRAAFTIAFNQHMATLDSQRSQHSQPPRCENLSQQPVKSV